jgi:hypothetical protein
MAAVISLAGWSYAPVFASCPDKLIKNQRNTPDFEFKSSLYSYNKTWSLKEIYVLKELLTDAVWLYVLVGGNRSKRNTRGWGLIS